MKYYYSTSLYYFDWQVLQILWSDSWGPISLCYWLNRWQHLDVVGRCWILSLRMDAHPVSKAKFSHPNLAKLKAFSTQGSLLFVWWLCKWTISHMMFLANKVVETPNMSIIWATRHMQWKDGLNGDIWYTSREWVNQMGHLIHTSSEWMGRMEKHWIHIQRIGME